jgi:hypothetical protein
LRSLAAPADIAFLVLAASSSAATGARSGGPIIPFKVRNNLRIDIQTRDAVTQAPLRNAAYGVYIHYGGGDVQAENTLNVP